MQPRLPLSAVALGIAGLIPFFGFSIATISHQGLPAQRYLLALLAYGGVVLAFLGGIHWGFVLHPALPATLSPNSRRDAVRLGLGVLPSLIGWVAVLTPLFGIPEVGLVVLIAGYLATIVGEQQFRQRGGVLPGGYLPLRWGLSIVVLALLITVLTLRLLGAQIARP